MNIKAFPTETVILHKQNGIIINNIVALVDPDHFTIDDASVFIEEGDFFERILPNGLKEYYKVLERGFYKGTLNVPDHYQTQVEKIDKNEVDYITEKHMKKIKEKPHKLFISHSSKDVDYMKSFVELLEDIGLPDGSIVCTSIPGHGIPGGAKIFDWLREQFIDCELRVVFALSNNYYSSPASLNEMGAAWIIKATDTLLLLPGFDFGSIQGCVDSRKIGIKLDAEESEVKFRLDELKDTLISEHSLPAITSARWERHRNSFIEKIKKIIPNENETKNGIQKVNLAIKAAILLAYASKDTYGQIMLLHSLGGTSISTCSWDFIGGDQNPRNVAEWESSIQELQGYGLVESAGVKGEIFKVTANGFKAADTIFQSLKIDVENNPEIYLNKE